jgi:hypothetical protein
MEADGIAVFSAASDNPAPVTASVTASVTIGHID